MRVENILVDLKIKDNIIPNIDTVIMDKDGVLINPHPWWSEIIKRRAWAIVQVYDLPYEENGNLTKLMGLASMRDELTPEGPTGILGEKEIVWCVRKYLNTQLNIQTVNNEIEDIFSRVKEEFKKDEHSFTRIIPRAFDFVAALYVKSIKMAIVTNDYVDTTRKALQSIGVSHMIPVIIGHENNRTAKETGNPANQAMQKLDSIFENTVIIGSTPNDITMAVACSAAAGIAVGTGQVSRLELMNHTPFVVADLSEISILPNKESR